MNRLPVLSISLALLAGCPPPDAAETGEEAPAMGGEASSEPTASDPTDPVALAMSAGPASISSAATIVAIGDDGEMSELRAGTNGWVCLADDPMTPGPDPMCLDPVWQAFVEAFEGRTAPAIDRVGFSYMLQGGQAASNVDPFATEPPAGEEWLVDGPHLMILVPDPARLEGIPTDPGNGGPYVMWKDTPYAHIMVPLGPR